MGTRRETNDDARHVTGVRARAKAEEDPDEEPDEPDHPQPQQDGRTQVGIPSVGMASREWEFDTKVLTVAQIADGATLVKILQETGTEGWELADVIDGGDKRVLLMRRPKRSAKESRRVGFAPPRPS